ncbi:HNH endonuclease signature motif containing protein [Blastococcus sp. PRF04-17]|uniref:HNH endonuclease signature motif containing protein n=1 Tax=Blastococcus sp. PRF04-17 TaxID=2933797 RepID=UPI001FF3DC84|nr:HNH endonuclease signature motif containing protein [Blastococcus sp. PRF04-17]UOY00660.1 HNH endonuclease [Blastococcus sp. PRF04-17]
MRSKNVMQHPSGSPLPELARAITTGAVRLAAATAAWLRLVAEFDERGGWKGVGIHSCAHWLAWQCGMSQVTAREHVRVARALPGLPLVDAAFSAGRLSYAKVRALTRIAAPDCEAPLLEFALTATASQTERFCRAWRRVDDEAAKPGAEWRQQVEQSFHAWTDDEGYLTLKVRMPAEAGAALMAAIDSLAEREARRERAQSKKATAAQDTIRAAGGQVDRDVEKRCGDDEAVGLARERTAARRIAALGALGALAEARVAMDRRPGDPPRREVVIHVDAGVLADDAAAGRAHFEGGPALTAAQARRLACEATAVVMLEKDHEPLAHGRRKRRATKAQRRVLLRRDGGCARPGCPETRVERLHAHHMRHWLFGGPTDVSNLVLLCDVDHGLVHDQELVLSRKAGRLIVLAPDGRRVWGTADAAFEGGLDRAADATFVGVPPLDTVVGRRPEEALPAAPAPRTGPPRTGPPRPGRRPTRPTRPRRRGTRGAVRPASRSTGRRTDRRTDRRVDLRREAAQMSRVLFPDGEPALAGHIQERSERLDLHWAIGVLIGNRDLARKLAAEAGVMLSG